MKLYITVGIPGSGKSTWAHKQKNCVLICPDDIRAELLGDASNQSNGSMIFKTAYNRITDALACGNDVIFDATSVKAKDRKRLIEWFGATAEMIAVYFDTPIEICRQRNANRSRFVPNEVIDRMARNLTPPKLDEGFSKIIKITS